MDRRQFKQQLGKVYAFKKECRKEAVEILKRNGCVIEMNLSGMFFIDKGVYSIMEARVNENNDIQVNIESDDDYTQEVVGFDEATWDLVMLSDFMHALYDADGQEEDETDGDGFLDLVKEEYGLGFSDTYDITDPGVTEGVLVYRRNSDGELERIACIEDGISVSDIEKMDDNEFEDFLKEHDLI